MICSQIHVQIEKKLFIEKIRRFAVPFITSYVIK